jgi:urea carboxylase
MGRLVYVAQKYNPVRATTPEGTVGLGGPLTVSEYRMRLVWVPLADIAVYPMAAPGGYQMWGRTLPAWDVS